MASNKGHPWSKCLLKVSSRGAYFQNAMLQGHYMVLKTKILKYIFKKKLQEKTKVRSGHFALGIFRPKFSLYEVISKCSIKFPIGFCKDEKIKAFSHGL